MASPGRGAVVKGKQAERDVAAYLTAHGIPARREVRTGTRDVHDEGDIVLATAPVTIEVKCWATPLTRGEVEALVAKLGHQRRPGDMGWLVERVVRKPAPDWRVWLAPFDAAWLISGAQPLIPRFECGAVMLHFDYATERLAEMMTPIDVSLAEINPFRGRS
jgi:Holliday junction resolvase